MSSFTPQELEKVGHVICQFGQPVRQTFGGHLLPRDYFCYDVETSGFSRKDDVILEWGHTLVRDCQVQPDAHIGVILNWYDTDMPAHVLDAKLERIAMQMRAQNRSWHLTPERIRDEGVHPMDGLEFIYEMVKTMHDQQMVMVTQNGLNFDNQMLEGHFAGDLQNDFKFDHTRVIDIGCIEKAGQMLDDRPMLPEPGESLGTYFKRVTHAKASGVKWNAEYCFNKYSLASDQLTTRHLHGAAADSFVLHLLMEKFRGIAESVRTVTPKPMPPKPNVVIAGKAVHGEFDNIPSRPSPADKPQSVEPRAARMRQRRR